MAAVPMPMASVPMPMAAVPMPVAAHPGSATRQETNLNNSHVTVTQS